MSFRSLMLGSALLPLAFAAPADAQDTAAAESRVESDASDDKQAGDKDKAEAAHNDARRILRKSEAEERRRERQV